MSLYEIHFLVPYTQAEVPGGSVVKNTLAKAGDSGSIPGLRRSPREEMETHLVTKQQKQQETHIT